MTTIRVSKRTRFTVIDRATVNDDRLSYRARGVLLWLLDKPDDWQTDANAVARAGTEGRDAIRAALNELQACGYLTRTTSQGDGGRWQTVVIVRERPGPENPTSGGKPGPENPASENQALSTEDGLPKTDGFSSASLQNENDKDPDPECVRCRGTGELPGGAAILRCPCTYVEDPALKLVGGAR